MPNDFSNLLRRMMIVAIGIRLDSIKEKKMLLALDILDCGMLIKEESEYSEKGKAALAEFHDLDEEELDLICWDVSVQEDWDDLVKEILGK